MAYTGKTGLDYFPLSTTIFDNDKIALIEGEFGSKGIVITLKLLCKIYSESYYYQWGDDECLLFAKKAGAEIVPRLVQEVINGLVRRSFFDKRVYDQFKILTSVGIQERYFEATDRRKSIRVIDEYLLIDTSLYKNVYIVGKDDNISQKNVNINRQSKGKEKKVKESKGNAPTIQSPDLFSQQGEKLPPVPAAPPHEASGLYPGENDLSLELPEMKIGMAIERVRIQSRVDIDREQVLGMWMIFKSDNFTGKKYYRGQEDVYSHFSNWLKDQKFSHGKSTGKQTTTGSISAIESATTDLERDIDEAIRKQHG